LSIESGQASRIAIGPASDEEKNHLASIAATPGAWDLFPPFFSIQQRSDLARPRTGGLVFYFFFDLSIGSGQCWVLGQTDLDPANRSRLVMPMNTTNFTMSTTSLSDLKPLNNNLMKAKPQLAI
jgi:hypothetical protein